MYGEAEKVLREALSTMPENPQFYYSLGVLLGRVNRLDVRLLSDYIRMHVQHF